MSITLKTVGVIAKDLAKTLTFYSTLGLDIPVHDEGEGNVEVVTSTGLILGFLSEETARESDPNFTAPVGSSLNLQFECDSAKAVDDLFAKLTAAGYKAYTEPWDAFWGQRFGRVVDPDDRIVNLYAEL